MNLDDLKENKKNYFWEKFSEISFKCNNNHAIYCKDFYLYQKEYCLSNKTLIADKSFIIVNNNVAECAGIFFLTKGIDTDDLEISFGRNFPGLLLIRDEITSNSIGFLKQRILSLLENKSKIIFTIPININLNKGYQSIFNNFQFSQSISWIKSITTSENKETLWKNIRKSYKSPINKGLKKQSFILIDSSNLNFDKFKLIKELHLKIGFHRWTLRIPSRHNS